MSADAAARDQPAEASSRVDLGTVKAVFGTRGWVKIHSETRPRDAIFDYSRWLLGARDDWRVYKLLEWRAQGPALIARLSGVDDRDAAEALVGKRIAVDAADLPPAPAGSYYWRDLIGLDVVNLAGERLGIVKSLAETGSNDVLCVRGDRDRFIPFVVGIYIVEVDLNARRITVDWQAED